MCEFGECFITKDILKAYLANKYLKYLYITKHYWFCRLYITLLSLFHIIILYRYSIFYAFLFYLLYYILLHHYFVMIFDPFLSYNHRAFITGFTPSSCSKNFRKFYFNFIKFYLHKFFIYLYNKVFAFIKFSISMEISAVFIKVNNFLFFFYWKRGTQWIIFTHNCIKIAEIILNGKKN